MKIIKPSFEIITPIEHIKTMMRRLEIAGRNCYKSEELICEGSDDRLITKIIDKKHLTVIEHDIITMRIICDRGISHEIVRHRIATYSQESTRFCNYSKKKFGTEINVIDIEKHFKTAEAFDLWWEAMLYLEQVYLKMLELGESPQIARSVLPNSLKTEIVMTMNHGSWRNFFQQRTALAAHPQMREIAQPMLDVFKSHLPVIYNDIEY